MNADEIRSGLYAADQLPMGRVKAERLESLAEQARAGNDPSLEADVLLDLIRAYEYGAMGDQMPVPMGRVLQLLDRHPAEVASQTYTIHWMLKWMTTSLINNPGVPLALVNRWLDEFESRYRAAGHSLRPVLDHRADFAYFLGDYEAAFAQAEAASAAPRDRMSDCHACERSGWGNMRADRGDDAAALAQWEPVLNGELHCQEEPHRVLANAVLPLIRLGRPGDARSAFLRGHSLARGNVNLRRAVGSLIEFCALTGNEPRGLEILTEHAAWVDDDGIDPVHRLAFGTGVCVLLRRLIALGHDDLALGDRSVTDVAATLEREVADLAAQFDARNGTSAVGDRVRARLLREPLLDSLPLGTPARLPRQAQASRPAPPPPRPVAAALPDLIAEAERMADLRQPGLAAAWERVAATGEPLPPRISAKVARARAGTLATTSPAEAATRLREIAADFDRLNDTGLALEARATAALAQSYGGDGAAARTAAAAVAAAADAAFAAGGMTARGYLASRRAVPVLALEGEPDSAQTVELVQAELALAEQLGEQRYVATYHAMLAQLSGVREDKDASRVHLNAARDLFRESGESWNAVGPAANLASLALEDGDASRAEELAREALAAGADVLTPLGVAQIRSIVVESLIRQKEREHDIVDAALAAAASWDGISEPDVLHNTFAAARAYGAAGRHAEAAALFAEVMPRVDVPYGPQEIAFTRAQYAKSLSKTGEHEEAAAQYLEALGVPDADPRWRARVAWWAAEALLSAGRDEESLAAYVRAADMLRAVGQVGSAARCLRSVAWIQFDGGGDPDARAQGIATMRAVLADLESRVADGAVGELVEELAATEKQLAQMES